MAFVFERARAYLNSDDLGKLFIEEMGWDNPAADVEILFNGEPLKLTAIAQKRGLGVFACPPLADGSLPDYATRRKIETLLRKSVHEHLIIFTNGDLSLQKWQWVRREPGKPTTSREFDYRGGQSGEALLQRLQHAVFSLEEEENLTIVDATSRVRATFDLERVTKRFYDRFKSEHAAFMKFLHGIPEEGMQRWYVSVTLNRLMFVYFIQKKQFLNNDPDYLRTKLIESGYKGKDTFYREFLCPLFFEGFAKKENERTAEINRLLGKVPYLNGGIFQRHQIEELYGKNIQIPDEAFKRLFDFFDGYRWHLDERPLRADNEINPDVLGYIFEKYINQKQMGAYYTKEDITDYISKSTVLPFIFEQARRLHKDVFEGENSIWALLETDPERYIYAAVRHGTERSLPVEIAVGIDDVSQRGEWNKAAPVEYALPTEIWREVVARRQRFDEVRTKLAAGEIHEINDLITYNLDIRQFAQDVVESLPTAEAVRSFLKATASIRVLDPTVGSGAFLFAALNILEPLYEGLFGRMQAFIDEMERSTEKHSPDKLKDFRGWLAQMAQHPNPRYFILKSIILYNLHGVDIMDEAVEICKLRLFLKLVAQIERFEDIEPLPDIDFNIRAGNTLVGFTSKEEVSRAIKEANVETKQGRMGFAPAEATQLRLISSEDAEALRRIELQAEDIDRLYRQFQQQQTKLGGIVTAEDKHALQKRLKTLEDELNRMLARQYGVEPSKAKEYGEWLVSHKPFHWLVEFYGIIKGGGFDVVVGNPPYVEYSKVKNEYKIRDYKTENCSNLYSFVIERSTSLLNQSGRTGVIVPVSLTSSIRMDPLRELINTNATHIWLSSFGIRPSRLFEGAEQRLTICLIHHQSNKNRTISIFSTKYHRWYSGERPVLFSLVQYHHTSPMIFPVYPKIGFANGNSVISKISSFSKESIQTITSFHSTESYIFYQEATGYWIKALDSVPYYSKNGNVSSPAHGRYLYFPDHEKATAVNAIVNSSLFFYYFCVYSDGYHLGDWLVSDFPLGKSIILNDVLIHFGKLLSQDLQNNAKVKRLLTRLGDTVEFAELDGIASKPLIDEVDKVLARHYGFSNEELDSIQNYDIKYRMGQDLNEEEE